MRSKIILPLLIVAVLSLGAWSGQGQTDRVRSVTYEYQVLADPTETAGMDEGIKKLNDLGAQGWELAGISRRGNAASQLYFKRVKKPL